MAFHVQSSLIDNAERAVVIATGMDTSDCLREQGNDVTIASYIIMVGALSVLFLAAGYEGFSTERFVAPAGNTVYYQQSDRIMF